MIDHPGASQSPAPCGLRKGEAEPSGAWQPIATAPLDGTVVDLWVIGWGRKTDMCWKLVERFRVDGWTDEPYGRGTLYASQQFSHWMPLPPPPQPDTGGEG